VYCALLLCYFVVIFIIIFWLWPICGDESTWWLHHICFIEQYTVRAIYSVISKSSETAACCPVSVCFIMQTSVTGVHNWCREPPVPVTLLASTAFLFASIALAVTTFLNVHFIKFVIRSDYVCHSTMLQYPPHFIFPGCGLAIVHRPMRVCHLMWTLGTLENF